MATTTSRPIDAAEAVVAPSASDAAPRRHRPMGQQPGLDGIRALSVAIVIAYHAGLSWMHGGFFGVEVFFVVSGFLITTLLLEERTLTGRVSLRSFWLRRPGWPCCTLAAMPSMRRWPRPSR